MAGDWQISQHHTTSGQVQSLDCIEIITNQLAVAEPPTILIQSR